MPQICYNIQQKCRSKNNKNKLRLNKHKIGECNFDVKANMSPTAC